MAGERPKREGVMLAYPVDEGRVARLGGLFFVQPKIKGERCRTEAFQGEPVLLSSYGNEFQFLDHIKDAIKDVWRAYGSIPFDGEIYCHGWSQERIRSCLGRKVNYNPEATKLEYHIFDIASDGGQSLRFTILYEISSKAVFNHPLIFVAPNTANFDTWKVAAAEYVDQGYEGIILRHLMAEYVPKRTVTMLKYKPTCIDEYKIISVKEAIDKHGEPKGTAGSFFVEDADGNTFYVGAGKLNWTERDAIWKYRDDAIGKMLVVKHEEITTDRGVPVCAVAVEVKL